MRGYHFLISAPYPYLSKTIHIQLSISNPYSDIVNCYLGTCESTICIRIESGIESFQLQQILIIKINYYKWSKTDVQNYIIPHPQSSNTLNYRCMIYWSLIELASLCPVPLSAINSLNRLTKLTMGKAQAWPIRFENFRIGQSIQIESDADSNLDRIWSFAGPYCYPYSVIVQLHCESKKLLEVMLVMFFDSQYMPMPTYIILNTPRNNVTHDSRLTDLW